jgi:ADP-ribosylglycohydrolase
LICSTLNGCLPGTRLWGHVSSLGQAHLGEPYNGLGNGAAMRVSPVGFGFGTTEEVIAWSKRSAEVTHNHPKGIRRAQATAAAIYLARRVRGREKMRHTIESEFRYDLNARLDEIRSTYSFNETGQRTVPQALTTFLESTSYEDAIRNAISLGGDADTLAAIASGVAEAYYGPAPEQLVAPVVAVLDACLLAVVDRFRKRFCLV